MPPADFPPEDGPQDQLREASIFATGDFLLFNALQRPPDDPHGDVHLQSKKADPQLRASRPCSCSPKLPPIIAVAKHPPPSSTDAATSGLFPAFAAVVNCTASMASIAEQRPSSATAHGVCGERRLSQHDAVPSVACGGSAEDVHVSSAVGGRRPRSAALTTPQLSGVDSQGVAPLTPRGGGDGGGGGSAGGFMTPSVDGQLSQKSLGSNRSGTDNGYGNCDGSTLASAGGGGGKFSVSAMLQVGEMGEVWQ